MKKRNYIILFISGAQQKTEYSDINQQDHKVKIVSLMSFIFLVELKVIK